MKDKGEGDEFTLRAISPPVLNERVSIVYQQAASAHFYLFIVTTEVWLYRDEEMKKMRREWWKMISTSHSVSVMQKLMGEIGWNNFSLSVSTKFCDQRCEGYLMEAENFFKCWVGIIKLLCILISYLRCILLIYFYSSLNKKVQEEENVINVAFLKWIVYIGRTHTFSYNINLWINCD